MFSPGHFEYTALGWCAVLGGAFIIGLNKGGLAGAGIIPILLFAVVLPPRQSTGYILPLLIVGDLCAIGVYRRVVIWKVFWTLLPPALAGVVIGYVCMGRIPENVFGPMIGWIVIGLIIVQLVRGALGVKLDRIFHSHAFGLFMGVLAGVTTMIANAAGPVANLYFLTVRLPKWNLIGTSAWFFFVINLCKVPFSAHLGLINGSSLSLALMLAPLVILGFFGGRYIAGAMPQKVFDTFLLSLAALGALRLIL